MTKIGISLSGYEGKKTRRKINREGFGYGYAVAAARRERTTILGLIKEGKGTPYIQDRLQMCEDLLKSMKVPKKKWDWT